MRAPAKRHKSFPAGRVCMICGRGSTLRLGGLSGAAPVLLALGYQWDVRNTLGFAHVSCIERARVRFAAGI